MLNTEKDQVPESSGGKAPLISFRSDSSMSEMTDVKLSVDPEEAKFQGPGKVDHMIVNFTPQRIALKAKCTNNASYRVDPVYLIIEPNKCRNLQVTRLPNPSCPPKKDKVLLVYAECDDKVTDIKAFFKSIETKTKPAFLKITLTVTDINKSSGSTSEAGKA